MTDPLLGGAPMNELPWMHFADQNPVTFWLLVLWLGGWFVAGVAAYFQTRGR